MHPCSVTLSHARPCARLIRVPPHAGGLRVDRFVLDRTAIPPTLLFKLLRKRAIAEFDQETGKTKRLQGLDKVYPGMVIRMPDGLVTAGTEPNKPTTNTSQGDRASSEFIQRKMLPKIFENTALAVFQKPPGLSCQGGSNVKYSVDKLLAEIDGSKESGYRLVHRLDRDTTGALVVARSRLAAAALTKAFKDRTVDKKYVAVLRGIPHNPKGTIDRALVNTGTMTVAANVDTPESEAKSAITRYRVLRKGKWKDIDIAIVELDILTGRKHQIRAHCSQVLRCPVLGDHKYSPTKLPQSKAQETMYLHLFKLTIPNVNVQGESIESPSATVSVTAPFPEFWKPVFDALGVSFSSKAATK
ncbi:hypothetical protein GGI07_003366 [Coemansia sp. Benny D115]|nr:hypothetical protein GGI07_003366 [Coemansia sp. Benny D115]